MSTRASAQASVRYADVPVPEVGTFTVTQVRSAIGAKPKSRGALRALGLGKIGRQNTLPDRPELRGMIRKVSHLVKVTEPNPNPKA